MSSVASPRSNTTTAVLKKLPGRFNVNARVYVESTEEEEERDEKLLDPEFGEK